MSDLLVKVALDESGVSSQLKSLMGKFKAAAKTMAAITVPAAAVLGIAKGGEALANLGEQAIEAAGGLEDAADKLGVTAERLQEQRILGKQVGIEYAQMDKALSILNRTIGQAALGQGSFEKTLAAAGITLRNSEGNVKSVSRVWDELSAKVQDGSLTQAQSIALASAAFGREGGAMVQVLRMTAEQQQRVIDTARTFGAVISNEVVVAADEYSDQLELIKAGTEALETQNKLILAPLTLKWAELKNEIAGATAELFRASGLINDNLALQQRRLKGVEQAMSVMRESLQAGGVEDVNAHPNMQPLLDEWQQLNTLISIAKQNARDAAASIVPSIGVDDEGEGVDSEQQQRERERQAKADAAASLELATAVAAERERLIQLEAEQEFEWRQTMFGERERFHAEELAQEFEWATVLAEERDRVNREEIDAMFEKEGILTQARKEGHAARQALDDMASGMQVKTALYSLASITAGVAQHNKTMFKINKVAAIGQAVMNVAQGVTRALAEYPPPWSFAMAAAQAAAGAAQISAIKNTQFGGNGSGTTPSAAGSTPTVNGQPAAAPTQRLIVEGISSSALFGGNAVRDLAERLLQFQKDGGQVILR